LLWLTSAGRRQRRESGASCTALGGLLSTLPPDACGCLHVHQRVSSRLSEESAPTVSSLTAAWWPRIVGGWPYRGAMAEPQVAKTHVEVRRSARRRRMVSAYREGDKVVVLLPARMSKGEEEHWVAEMLSRLQRSETRRRSPARTSDAALLARCEELAQRYLDDDAEPTSVRWVPPMRTRWASCTPTEGTIRVSERLRDVPSWVLDYVLVHELAHLRVPGHGKDFWELVHRYPKSERAMGYLEGISAAAGLGIEED
jgi:predicted metal-dependent hydrolase